MNILEFKNVTFGYSQNHKILNNINFTLEQGKTYALVGATGGGKSTIASLMAGLFQPDSGEVYFEEKLLSSYAPELVYSKIGFILQDPFLFTGNILENIMYGNPEFANYYEPNTDKTLVKTQLQTKLAEKGLNHLIDLFTDGLDTQVTNNSENVSLGQKQIVNFLRVILREPSFLILDEATANLDTITESLLEVILEKLPTTVTKVIIAHRLNTIKNADQVFLVGGGMVILKTD